MRVTLTPADYNILRQLVYEEMRRVEVLRNPRPTTRHEITDIFLVKAAANNGITAAEIDRKGTDPVYTLGIGENAIPYTILTSGTEDAVPEAQMEGYTEVVYNPFEASFPIDDYALAARTVSGKLVIISPPIMHARAVLTADLDRGTLDEWEYATADILVPKSDGSDGWETSYEITVYDDGTGAYSGSADPILAESQIDVKRMHGKWFYNGGGNCQG